MLLLEETAREVAKENNRNSGNQHTGQDGPSQNFGKAQWQKEVGEQIGVSHETVRKGTDVYRFAYPEARVHSTIAHHTRVCVPSPCQDSTDRRV